MGTQAVVGVVKDGVVQLKVITGTDGMKAGEMANWLRHNPEAEPQEVYDHALEIGFGSELTLVVQYAKDKVIYPPDPDSVPPLYSETFENANFNPRWEHGTADFKEVVDYDVPALKKKNRPGK